MLNAHAHAPSCLLAPGDDAPCPPMPAPCPCPMPRTGCSRRFLVVNRHRHTVPENPVYPSNRESTCTLHTAHTHPHTLWLRPHPRRSISHGTRPRLPGHLLAPCLSMTDAWPLRDCEGSSEPDAASLDLIEAVSVPPWTTDIGHCTSDIQEDARRAQRA